MTVRQTCTSFSLDALAGVAGKTKPPKGGAGLEAERLSDSLKPNAGARRVTERWPRDRPCNQPAANGLVQAEGDAWRRMPN